MIDVVDLSPWTLGGSDFLRDRSAVALDDALRSHGLVFVTGHGIPASVIAGVTDASRRFFAEPDDVKRALVPPVAGERGYVPPYAEMMCRSLGIDAPSGRFDPFEAFDVGTSATDYPRVRTADATFSPNRWPALPDFRRDVDLFFDEVGRVARTVMAALAAVLGRGATGFEPITDRSVDILRLAHYGTVDDPLVDGMSAHQDFGLLSVSHATGPGLQIAVDRRWVDAEAPDGALPVFVGETLARLSGERWLPTLHRVRPAAERYSAIYYHEGNADAPLAPGETIGAHISRKAAAVHPGGSAYWDAAALARLPR
ncbi:2-oxoglutarate and iron-dependent oxygenase domain-containing protein [Galbitalea sp. SE-J8]|uniref:2-oxoglutarate and iron-dependent oxygenase domain-containing protein n=1 Tax=Galbitalea sp. SE-J8 TaxID=3054952 RepID=UPI00259C903E|nr:2-oxoglutarate and iron-dependent oxygenase domain-containing protein [Galbitalea sp. SE-J8]MDM4763817.1 2-oxoglutarate and iron-dependent oxygenase domain-containing protein [Galbitalea sp. SE-J8]